MPVRVEFSMQCFDMGIGLVLIYIALIFAALICFFTMIELLILILVEFMN